jgi:hypothetical protein
VKCPDKRAAGEAKAILQHAGQSYAQLGPFDGMLQIMLITQALDQDTITQLEAIAGVTAVLYVQRPRADELAEAR